VICDIDVSGAEGVAKQIRESGGQASVCRMDVTDVESVEEGFAAQGAIDILVNNAGSYRDTAGSILDRDTDAWRRSIEINLESVYLCSRSAAQQMVSTDRGGVIVSVSSVDGTLPCLGVGYDVAKAGVNMFTRSLAVDLAPHKIRVNAVAPGFIAVRTLERMASGELAPLWPEGGTQTGLQNPLMAQRSSEVPLNRPGRPTDIGNAVLFLCSDASSYVTGQVLHVDGGWTLI
jgi:NAD(P)-dependent dehydrogenase (short-subunit alcohol dehydrogenase family)